MIREGNWKLENRNWKLENRNWKLENGNWKSQTRNSKSKVQTNGLTASFVFRVLPSAFLRRRSSPI
jgi:hypothetical protein